MRVEKNKNNSVRDLNPVSKSRWREAGWPVKIASIRPGFVQVEKRRIIIDKITTLKDYLRHEKSSFSICYSFSVVAINDNQAADSSQ